MDNFTLEMWPRMSDALRIRARQIAEKNIKAAHPKPVRASFEQHTIGEFSDGFVRQVKRLVLCALFAAFIPSSVRLFIIGAKTFEATLPDEVPGIAALVISLLAGLCTVILAETGQVIFSLAFATYKDHREPLIVGLTLSTLIALIGNFQVAIWSADNITVFHILEALAPPVLVMVLAYVQKGQVLDDARLRHANEAAYQSAAQQWDKEFRQVEKHPEWSGFYARALRDTYARTYIKRLTQAPLTDEQWIQIVSRELQADRWHEQLDTPTHAPKRVSMRVPRDTSDTPHDTRRKRSVVTHPDTSSGASGVEKVKHWLEANPQQLTRNRDEIANQFHVSRSTVNRAIAAVSRNGNGDT